MTEKPEKTRAADRTPDTPRPLTGQRVDRYEVGHRLGAGGMGEVYRAWDPLLERAVALKRLSAPNVGDVGVRERLLHEARALSALSHPAIASVFDVVASHDQLFIVEEFVAGSSLRQRLGRPVDLETFYPIAEGCLSALEEADRQGIVHCDIKPENIVLTEEGAPKILDFGLARRAAPERGEATVAMRSHSFSSEPHGGTTSYMAPEALVDSRADSRSDIWSLGVVFYEMLAGRHPFRRETPTATAASILTRDPEEPSRVRSGIPSDLDEIVMGMLVKEPRSRAGPAAELLSVVRGNSAASPAVRPVARRSRFAKPLGVALAAIALGVAIRGLGKWPPAGVVAEPPVYLAVEPFENLTADPHVTSFAHGFSEAVGERVAEVERLSVVPADTDFHVAARLEGDIQLVVDRLRVNYRVVDADGTATSGAIPGGVDDIFDLRDQVARNVSRVLANRFGLPALPVDERDAAATKPAAYAAYLHGRGDLARTNDPEAPAAAIRSFEEAVASDPGFVPARVGLAEALWRRATGPEGADEALAARAQEAARTAVEMAPASAFARRVRGSILLEAGETEAAEEELRRAFELDPADEESSRRLAAAQVGLGRSEDAGRTLARAVAAAPDDWVLHRNLGRHLFQQGKLEEAAAAYERAVALTPGNARGKSNLGGIYFYLGRNEKAIDSYLESIAIRPNYRAFSNIATVYKAEGRLEEAATNFEAALALDDRDYRVWGNVASVYEELPGREAQVAAAIERAIALAEARLAATPDDPIVLSLLAGYYVTSGRPDDARLAVDRALDLAPDDLDVLFHSGCVIESLGDRSRALGVLRRALDAGYPIGMIENEPDLRSLREAPEYREMIPSSAAVEAREN